MSCYKFKLWVPDLLSGIMQCQELVVARLKAQILKDCQHNTPSSINAIVFIKWLLQGFAPGQEEVAKAGAIPKMLALLETTSETVKARAAEALLVSNCAFHNLVSMWSLLQHTLRRDHGTGLGSYTCQGP